MRRRSTGVSGLLLCAGLAGCAGAPADPPDVLLVVLDACRPDKFGCYGFPRPTTPSIDRLAADRDSVVFERHYVQGDWTKPSTASLFTGLYLYQHRVAIGPEPIETPYWTPVLPAGFRTLAEAFREAGYATTGAVRIPHLLPKYGFDRGFEHYGYFGDDAAAVDATLQQMAAADAPFFGYVHLVGCHDPYPAQDRDAEYLAAFPQDYDEAARIRAGIDFADPSLWRRLGETVTDWTADDARFLHRIHEAKTRAMDRNVIGPMIDALKQRGLYDRTLIVVTADHGQELLEHGRYTHGHALWDRIGHVPLVVKFPKARRPAELGARWPGLTRAIDLFPALLAAAGIAPPDDLPGVDAFSAAPVEFALSERFSEGPEVDWAAVFEQGKVLRRVGRKIAVFDLASDPDERNDLADERPALIETARRAVEQLRREHPARLPIEDVARPEPTPEELEALRSLGYVQ